MRTRIFALVLAPLTMMATASLGTAPAHAATFSGSWVYFHLADSATIAGAESAAAAYVAMEGPVGFPIQFKSLDIQSGFLAYWPTSMPVANYGSSPIAGTSCATSDLGVGGVSRFASVLNPVAYDPAADPYSVYNTARSMHADTFWAGGYKGITHSAAAYPFTSQVVPAGTPIDVAVIDTGVTPVGPGGQTYPAPLGTISGLDGATVVNGPDFSFESQSPDLAHLDAFGHGTAMAGIIHAVAPQARIVNLKVGDATGAADPTQVIAAVDWAREHRTKYGLNIRVINLSYGVLSANSWLTDELSKAVDRAWQDGIVVVVAVGNYNDDPSTQTYGVASPAYNKSALAVSAYDSTTNFLAKGTVTDFSNTMGSNSRIPDLAAPGAHVTSWRVPNAQADNAIGEEMCALTSTGVPAYNYPISTDAAGRTWVRGSGTSQATALASGAAALVLSAWPQLKPDELKFFMRNHARQLAGGSRVNFGDGGIDLSGAGVYGATPNIGWTYNFGTVTGGASIEGSRGGDHMFDEGYTQRYADAWAQVCAIYYPNGGCPAPPATWGVIDYSGCTFPPAPFAVQDGQPLCGNKDIFGKTFASTTHASLANTDTTWSDKAWGGFWNGEQLLAPGAVDATGKVVGFVADPTTGQLAWPSAAYVPSTYWGGADVGWNTNWTGSRWVGRSWSGSRWVDGSWSGSRWVGRSWSGSRWVGSRWVGRSWSDGSWSSAGWR